MANRLMVVYEMGDKIKKARTDVKLTQRQLAKRCGCDRKTIMFIENSQSGVSILIFARICSALNLSADYLLGLKE